jgi:hypothetical protein
MMTHGTEMNVTTLIYNGVLYKIIIITSYKDNDPTTKVDWETTD